MKIKLISLFLALVALVIVVPIHAVTKYSCDFESEAARNRWVLNPTANQTIADKIQNKWYFGKPGNNTPNGHYGLYISDDEGATANYTNSACWVVAYDTISLDYLSSGSYTIVFDYCANSNETIYSDGLYLCWVPMRNMSGSLNNVVSLANGWIPDAMEEYIIPLRNTANRDYLSGASTWHQCAVTISGGLCDGTPHYLVFAWKNGTLAPKQPGGMIDNITISTSAPCDKPTDLTVSQQDTVFSLSWSGTASEYEVSAYSYDGKKWIGPKIVQGTQTELTGIPMGETDFIVRAVCDDDVYSLKAITTRSIYYPECVDYINIYNAKCYVNNSSPTDARTFDDFQLVAPVNYGPTSEKSRHTIHFDRNETDPRTGDLAKTVPDGELASIRLGNWDSGNEAERIEYTFDIDTANPILLLKYMPILEAPGHGPKDDPRFKLDVLIGDNSVGPGGQADFTCLNVWTGDSLKPGAEEQGWHAYKPAFSTSYMYVVWKDWTTIGVNLKPYISHNQPITVRLTTHDCTYMAHYGYAYFTLDCSDGKLKEMKYGQINPILKAPDGFNYRWAYASSERYRLSDGSLPEQYVLGRSQEYNAGMMDDSLYVVDCMYIPDTTYFYSLYATTLASEPVAAMNEPQIERNEQDSTYVVTFDASPSWVREIDHVTGDTLICNRYHIEHYEWNVSGISDGWSDEISPTFIFPRTGGEYDVVLRATSMGCESVLNSHLSLQSEDKSPIDCISIDEEERTRIIFRESRLLIIRGDKTYTPAGQEVK